uniref:Archease domain-containing protein n=1 Tax=Parastrongyloides trichosuri TaxID=131310 RepID=A0A0N5A1N7_PARTI
MENSTINGYESDNLPIAEIKYEYLDHTADIQLHGWGNNLEEAFEQTIIAMFGYISGDINEIQCLYSYDIKATGHDMNSLLFNVLDNFLYNFTTEPFFIPRRVKVIEFDRENFSITVRGWGESFDEKYHSMGTEVKAITYSNLQIHESPTKADIFVIIDI